MRKVSFQIWCVISACTKTSKNRLKRVDGWKARCSRMEREWGCMSAWHSHPVLSFFLPLWCEGGLFFLARLIFWNNCSFLLPMPRSADTQVIFTNTQIALCSTLSWSFSAPVVSKHQRCTAILLTQPGFPSESCEPAAAHNGHSAVPCWKGRDPRGRCLIYF